MTILPEVYIGNCARMGWKAHIGGMSMMPADVVENNEVELYWDLAIQTDMTVAHNRPDIILVEKATQKWTTISK